MSERRLEVMEALRAKLRTRSGDEARGGPARTAARYTEYRSSARSGPVYGGGGRLMMDGRTPPAHLRNSDSVLFGPYPAALNTDISQAVAASVSRRRVPRPHRRNRVKYDEANETQSVRPRQAAKQITCLFRLTRIFFILKHRCIFNVAI